ncbi:DNA (cytosine-5-)-methyltransferase [Bacillus pumilus]|uniref:DNA (cytosine-5-)-methyltransferase n=1 Tax=Bacillus pumilus TaxID=1408 RepID=UPI0028132476|nr:DNA (cytosine-5-)-methyltransferase [Bacillus pumilus]MDR0123084.1 DNA (cytosine-5-)-methyltransferase [Bacillus pumilus]
MEELKVKSQFTGIGAFEAALRNIGANFEVVGFSEIDKHAIKSYCAIHNIDESLNYGDISKIEKGKLPDFDILVGGSPCQSFSVAGHRKGFEDTRGTLFFQYIETLKEKQPKFFIFENVKGLINHDKGNTLNVMAQSFTEVGYRIDMELLNSKYFRVPQNRERIYIIGIREDLVENSQWSIDTKKNDVMSKGKRRLNDLDIKTFNFNWPKQNEVSKVLKEILEEYVDDKYYLSQEKTNSLVKQLENKKNLNKLSAEPVMIGHVDLKGHDAIKRVYSNSGISPTLTTMGGGHREPKVAVEKEVRAVLTPDREEKRQNGRRFKEDGEASFTVNTIDKHGVAIGNYPRYRIRKLTPLECWRLQAFDDEDFEKAVVAGISNSQLYKQAGNTITVTVLEEIFKELLNTYK